MTAGSQGGVTCGTGVFSQALCELLTYGGDERIAVDGATDLNRYGCAPWPRGEAITFSSSTATSVSELAYHETDRLRLDLLERFGCAQDAQALAALQAHVASRFAQVFEIDPAVAGSFLTPSGTDAQLLAVALIQLLAPDAQWVSLVCGADETGSGTPWSVTGRHFDAFTSLGMPVVPGDALAGMSDIAYDAVAIRDAAGRCRDLAEIDDEVARRVALHVGRGHRVMLHVMDQSKFGCWAPSPALTECLKARYGERVQVIVDACQLRLDREDIAACLERGHVALVTGSKFFTGPPFSGAAVLPRRLLDAVCGGDAKLPDGVRDYGFWTGESGFAPSFREALPQRAGACLRWLAALVEAERYYCVPRHRRLLGIDRLSEAVQRELERHNRYVEPLFQPDSAWWARTGMLGDELSARRTIFPFLVRARDGAYLSHEQARRLYALLNQDAGDRLASGNDADRAVMRRSCHIGQPVKLQGTSASALRLSVGARVVSQGWIDEPGRAASQRHDAHLADQCAQLRTVLRKVSLLVDAL